MAANNILSQFTIHEYEQVTSTNDILREMALNGAPTWTVVRSDAQSRGRGRENRSWHSAAGKGLWMSALLRPELNPKYLNFINLMCAVSIAEAIEHLLLSIGRTATIGLKWPNDVWMNGKKICGILPESSFSGESIQYVILGIGININHREADFPEALRPVATSLLLNTGVEWSLTHVFQEILYTIYHNYYAYIPHRSAELIQKYREKMLFIGEKRQINLNGAAFEGFIKGIDDSGYLLIADQSGKDFFLNSGEIIINHQRKQL